MGNREALEQTGSQILSAVRNELYLSMHFMAPALNSLQFKMDLFTKTVGTDAAYIRFNPGYLMITYLEHPRRLNRTYMHMLMHCLFRHMFGLRTHPDHELWDLCCDIAAESVIDSMEYAPINDIVTDYRSSVYEKLKQQVHVLTAQRLYRYFSQTMRDYNAEERMRQEFALDDHQFWEILNRQNENNGKEPRQSLPSDPRSSRGEDHNEEQQEKEQQPGRNDELPSSSQIRQREQDWKDNAQKVQSQMEVSGNERSDEQGDLIRLLQAENTRRTDYRKFLRKFAVLREEAGIDPDSFDYGFYNLGMEMYGNMPLIEENEYREAKRISELVIAIDTSASTQADLVQQFLNETAGILEAQESFFHRIQLHIIECDDRVENDVTITKPQQIRQYADGFTVKGGGGTDFRPVFTYVADLRRRHILTNLKGLMYYTDGFGIYPKTPTDYDTAFVFCEGEENGSRDMPSWAIRLFFRPEEAQRGQQGPKGEKDKTAR